MHVKSTLWRRSRGVYSVDIYLQCMYTCGDNNNNRHALPLFIFIFILFYFIFFNKRWLCVCVWTERVRACVLHYDFLSFFFFLILIKNSVLLSMSFQCLKIKIYRQ
jgi:hypothetical protein